MRPYHKFFKFCNKRSLISYKIIKQGEQIGEIFVYYREDVACPQAEGNSISTSYRRKK